MQLCEVYTSVQGEGPNVGKPTTFIRFGGCNLRCPGWGEGSLPDGTIVPGCDTVFAVYPEWRDAWGSVTPADIVDRVPLFPDRVCLTGGEPLIQPRKDLTALTYTLMARGYVIDVFTNGSQDIRYKMEYYSMPTVQFVVDYKLPGSGEFGSFNLGNLEHLQEKDAIKFVCKDREDFDIAKDVIGIQIGAHHPAQIFFGPVWGKMDPGQLAEWVAEEMPRAQLNIQTHKYIWDPDERQR